jgi:hypothetical protein
MKKIPMLERFAAQSLVEYDGELIFSKEKFAELIVRECCGAADEWYQKHNELHWDPAQHIRNHFGVEE